MSTAACSNVGRKSVNKVKAATLLKSRHCRLALAGCRQFTLLIAAVASYYQKHNQGNSAVNMQEIQNVQQFASCLVTFLLVSSNKSKSSTSVLKSNTGVSNI